MTDKPASKVKHFAKYAANFHRDEIERLEQELGSESNSERIVGIEEHIAIHRDLLLAQLEDRERYEDMIDQLEANGRQLINNSRKIAKSENLEEARSLYRVGDSGEQLRQKLSRLGVIVSARTCRTYIKILSKDLK